MQSKQPVKLLSKRTYLAMIEGSVDSRLFRHLYAEVDGREQDLLRDGEVSCAFYVSSILFHFKLLESPHATVEGLIRDLRRSGWQEVEKPEAGDVLIWERMAQAGGEKHLHAGFFMEGDVAISHVDSVRTPQRHHMTFGIEYGKPKRTIESAYHWSFE